MINNVTLVGRITRDIELKKTQSNASVASFTLAVNRPFAKDNETQADFISCVAWEKQAEVLNDYAHKGSLIGIVGRIQVRTYEADGTTRYATEVVAQSVQLLESKKERETFGKDPVHGQERVTNDESLPF
jgi:single-strand DNA-binding protein